MTAKYKSLLDVLEVCALLVVFRITNYLYFLTSFFTSFLQLTASARLLINYLHAYLVT